MTVVDIPAEFCVGMPYRSENMIGDHLNAAMQKTGCLAYKVEMATLLYASEGDEWAWNRLSMTLKRP